MKRRPALKSIYQIHRYFLGEDNLLQNEAEKTWPAKGGRWEAAGTLPSHSSGSKLCLSPPHASEPCLCGCSLRTKVVLQPRPPPVSRPISQVLPKVSSGRKHQSSPVIVFRAQVSHGSAKPKAKSKSQLLSWSKSRASCNTTELRKPVPMGVWPQGFLNPLSKTMSEKSLHTNTSLGGVTPPGSESNTP